MEFYRSRIFWLGHLVLMIGILSSKALISFGTGILILSAVISFIQYPKIFLAPPAQIVGFFILIAMPFISGLWSSNGAGWLANMNNKILLPAVAWSYWLAPKIDTKRFVYVSLVQFVLVILASIYSMMSYLLHSDQLTADYLRSKTLSVLLSDDHVQFSLIVFITLIHMLKEWSRFKVLFSTLVMIILSVNMIWLFIYLHILGAKTGLLLSYFGILVVWLKKSSRIYKVLAFPIVLGLLIIAYLLFPTFKNRLHYTLYDFNQYAHGQIINGLTDGARVLSWKAGVEVGTQQPFLGVGYGDLNDVFMQWHQVHSAHLEKYNWLQPENEWLMYLCGSGILGLISVSIGLWWIFSRSICRKELMFLILFTAQVLMMWYEVNLTSQLGVVVFVWSICWYQFPKHKLINPI